MLNVHIWCLISVACQWKWQTTSSPKSAQQRTKKHPPHSQQQISRIVHSVLRVQDQSNVRNYLRQHESPHLSTIQTGEKRLMSKRRHCINNNSNRRRHNRFRMRVDRMRIFSLNGRQDNMLQQRHILRLRRNYSSSNNNRCRLNLPCHRQTLSLRDGLKERNLLWRQRDRLLLRLLRPWESPLNNKLRQQDILPSNNLLHHHP